MSPGYNVSRWQPGIRWPEANESASARAEKQKEKAARRSEARARRGQAAPASRDVDPDIAGIVPGPQANPWGDDQRVEPEDDQAEEAEEK